MAHVVNVSLFSEMDQDGNQQFMEYEVTAEELEYMYNSIENNCNLIAFGDHIHHSDDIIKIQVIKDAGQAYRNI